MKKLMPHWTAKQVKAGERFARAWEKFFAESEAAAEENRSNLLDPAQVRISQIKDHYEKELLRYPNVVGIADGIRTKKGKPTGEPCLIVFVRHKVPQKELAEGDMLPSQIEGIPVDVVAVGDIEILSGFNAGH